MSEAAAELNISLTDIVIVAVLILIPVWFFSKKSRKPTDPPVWNSMVPILGNLVAFGKNPVDFVKWGRAKYGDVFETSILGKRMVFITHPKAHDVFFSARDEELSSREVYRFIVPVFGKGIIYDADPWPELMSEQLKFVTTGLNKNRFKIFVDIFSKEATDFFTAWPQSGTKDIFSELSELIILTASRCLLGHEIRNNIKDNNFSGLYHDLEQSLNPLLFFLPWLPTLSARTRDSARAKIVGLFSRVMADRRKNKTGEQHVDLLQSLLDAKYAEKYGGRPLTDDEISGILLATLFAGQHTSAITSTWTAICIIHNKDVYKKVMEEQREVLGRHKSMTEEAVNEMVYLKRCMKEALRLYPPLVMLMRWVKKERKCGQYIIPENTILTVSPAASMALDEVYPNHTKFDPDRYTEERAEDKKYDFAYIGFGGGKHKCLGESFAYLQVASVLSVLFNMYEFEPLDPLPPVCYESLVAGPKPPCRVKFNRRK
eukprot:ANDGO_02341.mRNA.1 Sterol 14-demethylase